MVSLTHIIHKCKKQKKVVSLYHDPTIQLVEVQTWQGEKHFHQQFFLKQFQENERKHLCKEYTILYQSQN